ncbi:glycosyltransferase family 2 protein [Saxibacter everestensis]|uniref:Glycosyltransferase family 2 protein n=1 Tax=Saxibacter everestensis TaxID=2909229 RepID=A0ABY8QTH6_9MICO|nr:glycosyltransferase family 2 protein [Brevibacteriaceae bacterium ZFBP1038]
MADLTPLGEHPGVTFIMPVLNEGPYIEAAVRTILAQEYQGPKEVILALGPSTDNTNDVVARLQAEDGRLHTVDNPQGATPIGLNLAIAASQYPVVIRVDAHSELSPDYAEVGVETLRRTGAANVGGLMLARGETPFQRAVARAYTSKVGLGGVAYHTGSEEGPAESAYLGIFRREALVNVGMFDETLRRGQDWELNLRIRDSGGLVWFNPALEVTYWPRATWSKVARQFYATGIWRGELIRRHGAKNGVRYFAPPALVIASAVSLLELLLQLSGSRGSWPKPLRTVAALVHVPSVTYVLGLLAVGVTAKKVSLRERLAFVAVLPTMHLSWGLGFVVGVIRGAGKTADTSR